MDLTLNLTLNSLCDILCELSKKVMNPKCKCVSYLHSIYFTLNVKQATFLSFTTIIYYHMITDNDCSVIEKGSLNKS